MNQFSKTFALEAARFGCLSVALHPGTVDTALSVPFQKGVPSGKLFEPSFSVSRMLAAIDALDLDQSGGFYDWDGKAIPW